MNLTTRLGLGKPLVGENYDVGVNNTNMDLIDAEFVAVDGRLDALENPTVPNEVALGLAAGFGAYGNGYATPGYRLSEGGKFVTLEGLIWRTGADLAIASNVSVNLLAANLGAALRPEYNKSFPASSGGLREARINMTSAGMLSVAFGNSGGTWEQNDTGYFVSLDGIGWWVV